VKIFKKGFTEDSLLSTYFFTKTYKLIFLKYSMKLKCNNNLISNNIKVCEGFSKVKGLMFSRKLKDNEGLFFNTNAIHMLFVFQSIDVVWLYDNKVVDKKENVKPFTFLVKPKFTANSILELPLGKAKLFKLGNKISLR